MGEIEEDYAFLGEIGTETSENFSSSALFVNNRPVHFKIDTRADVTVTPENIHENIITAPDLLRPTKTLFGPGEEESLPQEIFVVTGARKALLGRPAIEVLEVFQRVNAVEAEEIKSKFPKLFKGLSKVDGPYYIIKLKPEAKPFAISTPKRVAAPLLAKMKEELSRMEQMEIISKVDEPTEWRMTEWCAGKVVVPKANGKVGICVDLTKLNKSIPCLASTTR